MITPCTRRSTPNHHSHTRTYHTKVNVRTPGLHVYRNLLSGEDKHDLQQHAILLHQVMTYYLANDQRDKVFLSQKHNLKTKECYRLLHINDGILGKFNCQHFERYGEEGHKLTYFIGNQNIPSFLNKSLIAKINQLPEVIAISQDRPLNWNFTFNTYAMAKDNYLAGFDFHKDIPSNGEATMIYSQSLVNLSQLQIRHPDAPQSIETVDLSDNSLILLSEKARWNYEHRVIPVKTNNFLPIFKDSQESIGRMSFVLGFSVKEKGNRIPKESSPDPNCHFQI